jgi:hypothetical protein
MDALTEKRVRELRRNQRLAKIARSDAGKELLDLLDGEIDDLRRGFESADMSGLPLHEVAGLALAHRETVKTLKQFKNRLVGAAQIEAQTADELSNLLKEETDE